MKPNFDLKNKVAVITGGGGALGGCVAQSLSQSGVKIAILDLTQESAQRTVDIIEKEGGTAIGFAANVLSQESFTTQMVKRSDLPFIWTKRSSTQFNGKILFLKLEASFGLNFKIAKALLTSSPLT